MLAGGTENMTPGAAHPPRRARRLALRQVARGRGLALERAHRQLHQHADGRDRREPRDEVRHHPQGLRRLRAPRASSAGPRRTRRASSRTRLRRVEITTKKGTTQFAGRRAPAPADDARDARQAPARLQEGRRRHRGQRVGHLRRRGRARRDDRGVREEQGPRAARAHRVVGRRGRRPEHHGHRPGAGDQERARARRAQALGHGPRRGERGVRAAVPRRREGARARSRRRRT